MKKNIKYILLGITIFIVLINLIIANINPTAAASINNLTLNKNSKVAYDTASIISTGTSFNRYTIKYKSSTYIKGVLTYKVNGTTEKESFFLEPSSNWTTISSFINGYVDNRSATSSSVSVEFENISNSGTFSVESFELVSYPLIDDLIASISNSLAVPSYNNQKTVFIGNNNIKLGLSLKYGGSINYISANNNIFSSNYANINLINNADNGRFIQQCIYGNQKYLENGLSYISGKYDNIGGMYNPIQGGGIDSATQKEYNSKLVDIGITSDKKTIAIKTKPSLWRVNNTSYMNKYNDYYGGYTTDAYMLTTYTIRDNYIEVSASYIDFTDNVNDTNNGFSRSESPSVYTISALNEFYMYDLATKTPKQVSVGPTVDGNGFPQLNNGQLIPSHWGGFFSTNAGITEGIGLYHPTYDGSYQYMKGFVAGTSNSKVSTDSSTSFFTSIIHLQNGKISQFKKFNYDYILTLGNINNIRNIMDTYRNDHSYTLTVDPNGGSFNNKTTVTTLSPKLLAYWGNWNNIGAASRNGYTLLGYYTSSTGGEKVYDAAGAAVAGTYWKISTTTEEKYQYIGNKNLKIYARWQPNTYSITYDLAGGNANNPISYTIESANITLNNPTKEGYTFAGWTGTDLSSATKTVTITKGSTGNKSYTATWKKNEESPSESVKTYTLTLNPMNETNKTTSQKIEAGAVIGTLPTPTRKGYTFLGWYTDKTSGEKIIETTTYTYEKNITLYAQWKLVEYSITYELDGGIVSNNPNTYTVESANITLNNPTKEGYKFAGWLGTGISNATKTVTIQKGTTGIRKYIATWTPLSYKISFNPNGGKIDKTTKSVYAKEKLGTLPTPTKDKSSFLGWYTDKTNGEKIISTTIYNYEKDITLYAHWGEKNAPTIKYETEGATTNIPSEKVEKGKTYEVLPVPEKKGYQFLGWYTSKEYTEKVEVNTVVSSDTTLYAKWEIINYTIEYNLDGGVTNDNPNTYNVETKTFTLKKPTKEGYNFNGWLDETTGNIEETLKVEKGTTGNKIYTAIFSKIGEASLVEEKEETTIQKQEKFEIKKYIPLIVIIFMTILTIIGIISRKKERTKY